MMLRQQKREEKGMQKPECLSSCKYLVNTLTKCKKCIYHPDNLLDKWDEDRIDVIAQNGNDGEHYDIR